MRFLPMAVDTRGRRVLVLGASRAARIKIQTLLRSELAIDCVALAIDPKIQTLAASYPDRLRLIEEKIEPSIPLSGYDFLVLATGEKELERKIIRRARKLGLPLLHAADGDESDFHLLAMIERGPLVVSIQTGNPGLSKAIKSDLAPRLARFDTDAIEALNARQKDALKSSRESDRPFEERERE